MVGHRNATRKQRSMDELNSSSLMKRFTLTPAMRSVTSPPTAFQCMDLSFSNGTGKCSKPNVDGNKHRLYRGLHFPACSWKNTFALDWCDCERWHYQWHAIDALPPGRDSVIRRMALRITLEALENQCGQLPYPHVMINCTPLYRRLFWEILYDTLFPMGEPRRRYWWKGQGYYKVITYYRFALMYWGCQWKH